MKYLKYIKQFDFLSTEAKLTFNIKGETRIKTIIGGFISVLSVIVSTSLTLYFFIRFGAKNNKTLISSSQYSPNVNFTFSNKLPIMMRLSSQENQAYDNPESIYKIKMKYWYGGRSVDGEIQAQNHYDIDVEHCDINKHFGKFKALFEGISDLETFYCPVDWEFS